MARGRSESPGGRDAAIGTAARKDHSRTISKRKSHKCSESDSESDDDRSSRSDVEAKHGGRSKRKRSRSSKARSRRKYSDEDDSSSSLGSSDYSSEETEEERRRRKRRERKRREEKERKRRRRDKEDKRGKKDGADKKKKKKDKKKDSDRGKKGAVTNSWGKYGIIRENDMWNKRPEFTAWLLEVKKVNIESLPNWEEKQMFKDFMEDHNTGTFPSKKYYNLDAYFQRKMEKELINGLKDGVHTERTIFNDEEQRRLEMQKVRERQKEEEVEALKRSMQSGMAQAMKEQARLKEEMAYQYKLGNFEGGGCNSEKIGPRCSYVRKRKGLCRIING